MKIDFSQHYEKVKNFLDNITGKTILIAHYDTDGLTSALIFSRILEKYNLKYNKDFFIIIARDSYRSEYKNNEDISANLEKYNNIVFLDYSFDNYDKLNNKNLIIFDHHKSGIQTKLTINPAFNLTAEELPSSSALVYDFYYYLFGENDLLKKISFIGATSDFMVYASLPYLHSDTEDKELFLSNSILVKPIIFDIYQNLQYIYEHKGEEIILFEHLLEKTKDSLIGFFEFSNEHQKKILITKRDELKYTEYILNNALIDNKKKVIILEIEENKKEIKKYILNILEFMYSDYTKITYINRKKNFSCSIRSPKIDLLTIINHMKKEHPEFTGGGHSFAAGCAGPIEKRELLIKEILKEL